MVCRRQAQQAPVAAKLLTNGEARRARLDANSMWELGSRAERSNDGEASSALAMLKIAKGVSEIR
jgi:hypothetical protein